MIPEHIPDTLNFVVVCLSCEETIIGDEADVDAFVWLAHVNHGEQNEGAE